MVSWEPSHMADAWWQPYDETLATAIRASMRLLYGRNEQRKEALRQGAIPLLRVTARALRAARRGS
jgi:hypothetical protein